MSHYEHRKRNGFCCCPADEIKGNDHWKSCPETLVCVNDKIVVPDGMFNAVMDCHNYTPDPRVIRRELEVALCWLSENPIVPTMAQMEAILDSGHPCILDGAWYATEWQKHMFYLPEVEFGAYGRVTKAMGAVTLSREEGEKIIEYVKGAIHG